MEPTNSIEVEGLVREFKKGPRAVDGIDLRVEPGEIYGFLGPNGAGKSTTVLMLTTLLPPTAGTARVGGYDVVKEGPKVRSVIGAALQEAALDPMLTGRDHLRLQSTLQGISRAERKPRSQELLDRVGLSEAADRKVGGYSGGMKRRLDLALALVHRPRILFLDEPTTGLDVQSRTRPLGRGRAPRPRGRRDRLPDHPVPRGGGRARRPGRDHRPRAHRRRGNAAGPQGRDRAAERARDPRERSRSRAARRRARPVRRGARHGLRRSRRPAARGACGTPGRRPRSRRRRPHSRQPGDPGALARRCLPRQDRPVAGGRRGG